MKFRLLLVGFLLAVSIIAVHGNSSTLVSPGPSPSHPETLAMAGPSNQNVTVFVNPNATIDLNRSQKKITVEIGLNNTGPNGPQYTSVSVILSYNSHVLNASAGNLDYSTNVLSQSSSPKTVLRDCLDGIPANNGSPNLCGADDRGGRVSFAEAIAGQPVPNGTQGNIFFITFVANTTAPNITLINLDEVILANAGLQVPTTTLGGYYTSLKCGSGPCSLARPNFTYLPKIPTQGSVTVFYANSSTATGGGTIVDYFWTFGDTASLRPYRDSGKNSTVTYIYPISGTYVVTLYITDSYGVRSTKAIQIIVVNANIDMGIAGIDVEPNPIGLNSGAIFNITATLHNYGGLPENASLSLSITINGKAVPLASRDFLDNIKPGNERTVSAKWDSSGLPPNVYRVDAITPLKINESATDPNPNRKTVWIQLIPLQPTGGLSLLGTAGISVLVLGAGGAGVSFIRKRTRVVDDSL